MKAYIIAHGTMDGYEQYPKQAEYSDIPKSIYDLRAELDSSGDFLSKPIGYYIQIDNNGVWVSIMKLMRDGESDGNRPGFFAISAFIPASQSISGGDLKDKLDAVMSQYLSSYTNGMRTCSIGVDWSFVSNASAELNTMCQPRRKTINTHYTPSNNFAYVPATTEEQIIQLLDKPFQPEYGAYKAVFIGTHLQHPVRLTQQTCLNIDLENEEYDIIWNGNVNGWNNLPQKVRKKEIASGSYTFEKKYYDSLPVPYKSGVLDDVNTTLTLDVPNLQPQTNQITLHYNHPEAIVMVQATSLSRTINDNNNILEFKGQEFADEIKVHLILKDGYRCDDFIVIPSECPNNTYYVGSIVKLKKITLNVLENSDNRTSNYKDNIRISKSGKSFPLEFNKANASLCLSIPESDDFVKEYAVSLINGTYYSLSNLRAVQSGFYTINIQRKQNSQIINPEPVPQKRPVYLDCKIIDKIEVYYNGQPCKIINDSIRITGTRDNILVKIGDKKLKFKKVGNNSIKIYSPLFGCLSGGNTRLILIGIVATLMLLASVLLTLQFTNTIDIKKWFAPKEETGQVESSGKEENPPAIPSADTIPEEQRLYNELDNILKIQRISWNYKTITDLVGKYDTTTVIEDNHIAYSLYKELVWMQCRYRFDGYKKDDLTDQYTTHKYFQNHILKGGWIHGITKHCIQSTRATFATDDIMEFLKDVINASNAKQQQFFEQYVRTKKVEKMTFPEVKQLWNDFKEPSPSKSGNGATKTSNNGSSSNTGTSSNPSNPPAEENAENY